MIYPPIPKNEAERLRILEEYHILYTEEEEDFDNITKLAALICDTKIALITLVTKDCVWHKSRYGTELKEAAREHSFCAHGINYPNTPFIVEDASKDERFFDNPFVLPENGIRFYAGIPLTIEPDISLGMLCVVDFQARKLSDKQIEQLKLLAKQVLVLFNVHKTKRRVEKISKTIEKSNLLFNEAQKLAKLGAWELDLETNETFWTEEVYTIHEVDSDFRHDLHNGIEFYHLDDRDMVIASIQKTIQTQKPTEFEARLITAKGNLKHVHITVNSYYENEKQKLIGCIQDVTLQKESLYIDKLLKSFFDLSPIGIALNDFETGKFLDVNKKVFEMAGYTKEEFLSLSYWDITPRKYEPNEREALVSLREKGKYGPYQKEYIKKDGTLYPVLLEGILVEDIYGKKRIWSVIEDITEKVEKEKVLRESKEKYEALVENIPGIVYRYKYGEEWDLVYISPYVETLCGYAPQDLLHCEKVCFHALVLQDDFLARKEAIEEAIQGKGTWEVEYRVRAKNGTTKWFYDKGRVIKNSTTGETFLDGVILEITDKIVLVEGLREAMKLAERASKVKSEFLANMSHEIRTPINGIIGFLELLRRTNLDTTQKEYVETIYNSSNSLLQIINDILGFSKIESGKLELEYVETNLYDLVEQTLHLVTIEAEKKKLQLILDMDPKVPIKIKTDPVRLKQVFSNLLSNAVKFTERGEIIFRVRFFPESEKLGKFLFEVIDTGIGITEEQRKKLFQAFSQADTSTTRKFGGTGLGLIISNLIVNKMNSQIHVDSVYGKGSRFYFHIFADYKMENFEPIPNLKLLYYESNFKRREIVKKYFDSWQIKTIEIDSIHLIEENLETTNFNAILVSLENSQAHLLSFLERIRARVSEPIFLIVNYLLAEEIKKTYSYTSDYKILNHTLNFMNLHYHLKNLNQLTVKKEETKEITLINQNKAQLKVLIAEDNPTNLLLVKLLLKEILPNLQIHEAHNGKEAILKAQEALFDFILMDVQMPEMDGLEATREIRKKPMNAKTPIIALTAGVLKEEQEKCLNAGMNMVLIKPIQLEALRKVILELSTNNQTESNLRISSNDSSSNHFITKENFEKEKLLELVDHNIEMYKELLSSFSGLGEKVTSLSEAVSSKNYERIRKISHELKGTSGNLFFHRLHNLSKILEQKAKEQNENLQDTYSELLSEWKIIENFIKEELKSS